MTNHSQSKPALHEHRSWVCHAGFDFDEMDVEEQRLGLIEELLSEGCVDELALQEAVTVLLGLSTDTHVLTSQGCCQVSALTPHPSHYKPAMQACLARLLHDCQGIAVSMDLSTNNMQ